MHWEWWQPSFRQEGSGLSLLGLMATLAAGVTHFDVQPVHDRTPNDFYHWAQEIVEYLWEAYQRDRAELEQRVEEESSESSGTPNPDQQEGQHQLGSEPSDVTQQVERDREVRWAQELNRVYLYFRASGQARAAFTSLRND